MDKAYTDEYKVLTKNEHIKYKENMWSCVI